MAERTRIYTVPPGRNFLDELARAVLAGELAATGGRAPDPLALTDYTILLPTRRATRALNEAFLARARRPAMLLPAIRPIAEADEDLGILSSLAREGSDQAGGGDLPPAIGSLERRLVLTQLVMRWRAAEAEAARRAGDTPHLGPDPTALDRDTPAKASGLAAELARLMDMIETEGVSLASLQELVPDTFSAHWQKTIDFLKILTELWPAYLAAGELLSPADRRNRLILAEAARLAAHPPAGPVIVAGVTGSIPATAELMRQVLRLDSGAILLPGLDVDLDEASWQAIAPTDPDAERHPEHPQYGLKVLLDRLGVGRADVAVLTETPLTTPEAARARLVSEAMRPAGTTGLWRGFAETTDRDRVAAGLDGLTLLAAPSAEDEAEAVALILREALETPGRTAALVSPDRLLARRVAVRLETWGIRVDDSAGRPFPKTVPGAFLDLVVEAIQHDFEPARLMALLRHPLTRIGLTPFEVRRTARYLELAAFRTTYLDRGLDGVATALARAEREVRVEKTRRDRAVGRLWPEDWEAAHDLVRRLRDAYEPLLAQFAESGTIPLARLAKAHAETAERIAALPDTDMAADGGSPLYQGEAGEEAATLLAGLMDTSMPAPAIEAGDYADFYRSLVATESVRPRVPVHPRLSIWGPFEARLQRPDVVVLGSLNEATWPEAVDPGPWLNRPMRRALGLPSPEEKLGHAAHDFSSLLGAERVYLTRAEKVAGVPTVPSRWLMRLEALLDGLGLGDMLERDRSWLAWARAREEITAPIRIAPPAPRPPVALRPRTLSVSAIESWIASPYAIFARHILKLEALPALGQSPDAALKGMLTHEIMKRFAGRFPAALPHDGVRELDRIIAEVLSPFSTSPRVAAFWRPRLERFARWLADTEPARRDGVTRVVAEVSGRREIDAPAGAFVLTARADRIDVAARGLVITDYKTGQLPTDTAVTRLLAPQLPLEAAIAAVGGFEGIDTGAVSMLRYIRASGGEPPGEEHVVATDDVGGLAAAALESLTRLVAEFDDDATPYAALRRAGFDYRFDDYAGLARVAEWSGQADEEG
jgi:ATP-dependent helicase/nuclease subunit B